MSETPVKKKDNRQKSPWVRTKKRKRPKKDSKTFDAERKKSLAESDKGSWFKQDGQWPSQTTSLKQGPSSASASKRKLDSSLATYQKLFQLDDTDCSSDESDYSSGSEDSCSVDEEDDRKDQEGFKVPTGLSIVSPGSLQTHLNESAVCKDCRSPLEILEKNGCRQGLGTKWIFCCSNKECASHETRLPFPTSEKEGKFYAVNRASVLAFRAIGKGRSAARKCFSIMNLPEPVSSSPWTKHTQILAEKIEEVAQESFEEAAWELKVLKRMKGDIEECTDEELKEKIVDVPASFDCSWSSRGWSARDGVVGVISEETGKVLDIVHMSSICGHCKAMEEKRNNGEKTRLEFLEWYIQHEPNCLLNHEGSSQSMEAAGVLKLYRRSLEKHKIRYTPFIGDGDSSSYSAVCKDCPYGPTFFIPKNDCISHVTKRMGSNLRSIVRDYKGRRLEDGKYISGPGRLTLARIDTMQSFYGLSIRQNKGNAKAMAKATQAILYHYSSTPENPQHGDCPTGPSSWCSFQRDKANGTNLHQPIKDPLPPAIVKVIKPVFDRLGDEKFLAGCENCSTQNPNESLHHVIWGFAPKEQFTSPQECQLAVNLGALVFNSGVEVSYAKLMPLAGLPVTSQMRKAWKKIDFKRIYDAEYKELAEVKDRRKKYKRLKSKKTDAFVHSEGIQYQSQGFYATTQTTQSKGKGVGKNSVGQGRGRGTSRARGRGARGKRGGN